jgi:signal peptidase II
VQERRAAPPLSGPERQRHDALRRLLVATSIAAVVVAADQATKSWAVGRLAHGPVHVAWKLDFELTYNSGSAFSFARGWAPVLGGLAVVAVLLLLTAVRKLRSTGLAVALGLVVGGAVGNLSDRLFRSAHGSVVDFVDFHFWPTFNVADACIVVGGIAAAVVLWRGEGRTEAVPTTDTGSSQPRGDHSTG